MVSALVLSPCASRKPCDIALSHTASTGSRWRWPLGAQLRCTALRRRARPRSLRAISFAVACVCDCYLFSLLFSFCCYADSFAVLPLSCCTRIWLTYGRLREQEKARENKTTTTNDKRAYEYEGEPARGRVQQHRQHHHPRHPSVVVLFSRRFGFTLRFVVSARLRCFAFGADCDRPRSDRRIANAGNRAARTSRRAAIELQRLG